MVFDEIQAKAYIQANQTLPPNFVKARAGKVKLDALVKGKGFKDLIERIEHVEGTNKAKARKKYSRSIIDFFHRLLRPLDNIYTAVGDTKVYTEIKDEAVAKKFIASIADIRDNKSLEKWLQEFWMPAYHTDPNGVIFKEYTTENDENRCWPTYQSIDILQNYVAKGQALELLLFSPVDIKIGKEKMKMWRLVDDVTDWVFTQKSNEEPTLRTNENPITINGKEKKTFEHPFGKVPGIVNSDIIDLEENIRLSPLHPIIELSEEYAKDQSVKTIFKFINGMPVPWEIGVKCATCNGTAKVDGEKCSDCWNGMAINSDVTNKIMLPQQKQAEQKIVPDVGGFIFPPDHIIGQLTDEIKLMESVANITHWGVSPELEASISKTATEIIANLQPKEKRLNQYSDVAEWVEWFFSDLLLEFIKPENDFKISVTYGRQYLLVSADILEKRYLESREKNAPITILDRDFREYLTAKYRNDPYTLRVETIKSIVEPYLHNDLKTVKELFGIDEAKKKVLFRDFWEQFPKTESIATEITKKAFDEWLENNLVETPPIKTEQ